jgi:hypothetical protein
MVRTSRHTCPFDKLRAGSEQGRGIEQLLIDCAEALRDGSIATFLKSLTHEEAQIIACSDDFTAAARVVRLLNSAAFADRTVSANEDLFLSRVNARILSRTSPPPKGGG